MTQDEFKQRHAEAWRRLEAMLAPRKASAPVVSARDLVDLADFDREYRRVCKHLALARQRLYGSDLVTYLNDLALRANRRFYDRRRQFMPAVARFFAGGFPALVRAHAAAVAVSAALFVLPAAAMIVALRAEPDLIHSMMDADQIRRLEEMYQPGSAYRSSERAAANDLQMFGFYIANNIGIGFRTFAGGMVFGIGSIFFVGLNGMFLGAVTGHLQHIGYGETFFPFAAGHSAPELMALVLTGAAGLSLGASAIAPGRLTRLESLERGATRSVLMVCGATAMLLLAAGIEAFWSARSGVHDAVKIGVGAALWALLLLYFGFAGRRDGP